jgi:hypothetical protein
MAGHALRSWRRREFISHFVDGEMIELGQDARQVVAVTLDVAPPRRPVDRGQTKYVGAAAARVRVDRLVGHLQIQPRRDAVFHEVQLGRRQ